LQHAGVGLDEETAQAVGDENDDEGDKGTQQGLDDFPDQIVIYDFFIRHSIGTIAEPGPIPASQPPVIAMIV
jgi:hypothetical protein